MIRTIISNGQEGFLQDGVPANQALLSRSYGIAVGPDNLIYFTESGSNRVRFMDAAGILRTLAGSGRYGYSPDGELATRADLSNPGALSIDSSGVVVFVERDLALLRAITSNGHLTALIQSGLAQLPGIVSTPVTARISDTSVVALWGDKLLVGNSCSLYSIRRNSNIVELFLDNPRFERAY